MNCSYIMSKNSIKKVHENLFLMFGRGKTFSHARLKKLVSDWEFQKGLWKGGCLTVESGYQVSSVFFFLYPAELVVVFNMVSRSGTVFKSCTFFGTN